MYTCKRRSMNILKHLFFFNIFSCFIFTINNSPTRKRSYYHAPAQPAIICLFLTTPLYARSKLGFNQPVNMVTLSRADAK